MELKLIKPKKIELTEKEIENQILAYLNTIGIAFKMDFSGKPILKKDGTRILIPWGSKWSPKGMSDILCFSEGQTYFFEVKIHRDKNFIMKNYLKLLSIVPEFCQNRTHAHYAKQIHFLDSVKRHGIKGGFVSSIEDCLAIIEADF